MNKPSHHHVHMKKDLRLSHQWLRTASSAHSFIPKIEIEGSIEMLINSDQPARCHTPEDSNLQVNTNFSYSGFLSFGHWTSSRFLLKLHTAEWQLFHGAKEVKKTRLFTNPVILFVFRTVKKNQNASRPQHRFRRPLPGPLHILLSESFYEHFASSNTCYCACVYHIPSLDQPNNISWCVNIMKLLIT
jgi:hypothetical protein